MVQDTFIATYCEARRRSAGLIQGPLGKASFSLNETSSALEIRLPAVRAFLHWTLRVVAPILIFALTMSFNTTVSSADQSGGFVKNPIGLKAVFNAPSIVDITANGLVISTAGISALQNNSPVGIQPGLLLVNQKTGKTVNFLVEHQCESKVYLNKVPLKDLCAFLKADQFNKQSINIFSEACNSVFNPKLASASSSNMQLLSNDARFIWLIASGKIIELDREARSCRVLKTPMSWRLASADTSNWNAKSDGSSLWLSTGHAISRIGEIDLKLKFHRTLKELNQTPLVRKFGKLGGVRSNLVLSNGKIWFATDFPSKTNCPGPFGAVLPCQDPYGLIALNSTNGKLRRIIDDSRYGLGSSPIIDGFGSLILASSGQNLWASALDERQLVQLDGRNGKLIRVIKLTGGWAAVSIAASRNAVWIVNGETQGSYSQTMSEYSAKSGLFIKSLGACGFPSRSGACSTDDLYNYEN